MFPGLSTFRKRDLETMFPGLSTFRNMARKQCFLVCPPLGNMARKLCFKQTDRNIIICKRKLFLRLSKYVNHNNEDKN